MGQKNIMKQKDWSNEVFYDEVCLGENSVKIAEKMMNQRPYCLLGVILMQDKYGMVALGTGILLSPNLVLTAAHNLYQHSTRTHFKNFKFYPGQSGSLGKQIKVKSTFIPQKFTKYNNVFSDYALMVLEEKAIISQSFIPLKSNFNSVEEGEKICIIGYNGKELHSSDPSDPYKLTLYQYGLIRSNERIVSIDTKEGVILHKISTVAGQSGAPIILIDQNEKMWIVGVHKGGVKKIVDNHQQWFNTGRLLNEKIVKMLKQESQKLCAMSFEDDIQQNEILQIKFDEEILQERAYHCLETDDFQEALTYYRELASVYNSSEGYIGIGYVLNKMKEYEEALPNLIQAIEFNPKLQAAYINIATSLENLQKLEDAVYYLRKSISENALTDEKIYLMLASCLSKLSQKEEALGFFQKALKMNPNSSLGYNSMGLHLQNFFGKRKQALNCYIRAISLDAENQAAHFNMGHVLKTMKRPWEAIGSYRRSIAINPQDYDAHFQMGDTFIDLNMFEQSVECFNKAIQINPNFKFAYNNMAYSLNLLGKYEEAIENCKKAIELDPEYSNAFCHWSTALIHLKQYEEAVKYSSKAISLKKKYGKAHANLGIALWKSGKIEQAGASLRQAIEIEPNNIEFYKYFNDYCIECGKCHEGLIFLTEIMSKNLDYVAYSSQAYQDLKKNYYSLQS